MEPRTHLKIDPAWCGALIALAPDRAEVQLSTRPEMAADAEGLIHGGFIFGLADYAAMLAVNDPNVVLGAANLRFTAPVRLGDTVHAVATVEAAEGRKRTIQIHCAVADRAVLTGTLTAFVLDRHVLASG